MQIELSYEDAAKQIIEFVKECDVTALAWIYLSCFGAVKDCDESLDQDCFIVTYHEGLGPSNS